MRAREIALGDDGYFVFHWLNGEHKIGYLSEVIQNILPSFGKISQKNPKDL